MNFNPEINTKEKFQNLIDICKSNFQMTHNEAICFYIMVNRFYDSVQKGTNRYTKEINELPKSVFELVKRLEDWDNCLKGGKVRDYRGQSYGTTLQNNNIIARKFFLEPMEVISLNKDLENNASENNNKSNLPKFPSELTMAKIFKFYKDSEMPEVINRSSVESFKEHKFYSIYESCEQIIAEHEQQKISQVFQNGTPGSGASKPKRRI